MVVGAMLANANETSALRPRLAPAVLAAAVAAALIAPGGAGAGAPPPRAGEDALIVVRDGGGAGETRELLDEAAESAGLEIEGAVPEVGVGTVDLPAGGGVAALRAELEDEPGVVAVEPDVRLELRAPVSDPAFRTRDPDAPEGDRYQWHLRKSGFQRAWRRSDGSGAVVAVIDTGAEASHPDIGPRVKAAFDKDDTLLHGGADRDENGHGTHVSGLACGQTDDRYGIASAGYRCSLLVYKSDLTIGSITESIVEATDRGADVINMSFGGDESSRALEEAVDYAAARDVVMVAAADNEDVEDQGIPAEYLQPVGTGPKLRQGKGLVVTAAEYDGSRAWFEPGRGTGISLAAFGSAGEGHRGIFSAFPGPFTEQELAGCLCRGELSGDARFGYLEGTSMATPQVAGAAALIRSARPMISGRKVVELIKRKATRPGGAYSDELGWGILNAPRALKAALKKKRR
jgi:subtilisin family serine protease